jgi:Tfp pilus assembly protein PilF
MKKTLLACLAVATLLFIACSTQPSGHRAEDNLARTLLDSALLYIDRQDLQSAMLQLKKAEKLLPALENAKTKYQICQYIG